MTAILLVPGLDFEISTDAIDGSAAVGSVIEPVNGQYAGKVAATRTSGTTSALQMIATKDFRIGGQFGYQFIDTVVATVVG